MSALERRINIAAVVLPLLGVAAAIYLLWGGLVDALDLAILAFMYVITSFGVYVGYHRLLTHRSFEAPPVVRATFAILGCMAMQGPPIRWVADHRQHHDFADEHGDPHSPHTHAEPGFVGMLKGMWHGHVGWLWDKDLERGSARRYANDLLNDPVVRWVDKYFFYWVGLGFAIPFALGFAFGGSLEAGLTAMLWGGAVRMFLVHHATWSVNSICHMYGSHPFDSGDHSRNNWAIAFVTLGEGWHHNHHAFPTSARHGLGKFQFDPGYRLIRTLEFFGLASNVKGVSPQQLDRKRLDHEVELDTQPVESSQPDATVPAAEERIPVAH